MSLSSAELEELYAQLEKPLYNFALRWVWNPALAEELVQEAFLRLWNHKSIERTTMKALLYKIVQNLALNERRKQAFRNKIPLIGWLLVEVDEVTLESDFIKKQNLEQLKNSLEQLPDDLREVLLLCEFSDLTQEEIGESLKIPAGTVASRRNRAMKLIKDAHSSPTYLTLVSKEQNL